jgi:nucleoside-diphosphate-sugar epimerase
MRILITGATGFIGGSLAQFLHQKREHVTALVRPSSDCSKLSGIPCHFYDGTYQSISALFEKQTFDNVIHLASMATHDCPPDQIESMIAANITLGTFLLEAIHRYGCPFLINTSTYAKYYDNHQYKPISFYAATKKAFEDIIEFYVLDKKIRVISLTLYDVYGDHDDRNKLINQLVRSSPAQHPIAVSPGDQKLQMIFIKDVLDAYRQAMALIPHIRQNHEIYGVYGDEKHTLKEIVSMIEALTGRAVPVEWGKKPYYSFQIMDPYFGEKLPYWEAKISLKEGLSIMLEKEATS